MTTQRESKISSGILTALRRVGVFCFKVHGGPMTMVGLPDIVACVDGKFVCFETKTPEKRKNQSVAQKRIEGLIRQAGGISQVVCGVEEALSIIADVRGQARAAADPRGPSIHVNRCKNLDADGHCGCE